MRDNPIIQFFIQIMTVVAGILMLKVLVSFLPSAGILGSVKAVVASV